MSDITNAMKQICEEKNLSYEAVVETIESALAAAYRKDFGEKNQNIKVEFDPETGQSKVYDVKTVVEDLPEEVESEPTRTLQAGGKLKVESSGDKKEKNTEKKAETAAAETEAGQEASEEEVRKFNPRTELQLKDAKLIKKTAKVGEIIKTKLEIPADYGRMAAQTAKQVIIQKLREAEREMIFSEFKNKEHEVVAGVVQRREGRIVLVDLDKAVGILPAEEQIMNEKYRTGDRLKVYVKQVAITAKGPEIILSRTSDEILKKVFYLEIPEISNGLVEIKAVAREAGSRSKVAVFTASENVDPIGSCVGQRGSRIQTIISELGGEKIDIIEYDEDIVKFIGQSLAPAKILTAEVNREEKKAIVKVTEDQLSLAIGREGQNVRLAAKLTGYKLDIVGEKAEVKKVEEETKLETEVEKQEEKKA
ncbi:MAG: transcription termination/antitermination protein NusA [Parcubacteria group bacterium]|nr:transcription termination/antitermination protein NusA [Parcubacteria group bacterium]